MGAEPVLEGTEAAPPPSSTQGMGWSGGVAPELDWRALEEGDLLGDARAARGPHDAQVGGRTR